MMKILYIPLDERPCNRLYPVQNVAGTPEVTLISPPKELLGKKKLPADVADIWEYIEKNIEGVSTAVLSTEMLLYGGLLPSRVHHLGQTDLDLYKSRLTKLKSDHPDLKIFLSNLIMRTPRYDSNDEEPEYYGEYGAAIFNYGFLRDKQQRESLTEKESVKMQRLEEKIPEAILLDYEERRAFNVQANLLNIYLVEQDVVDFLVIPQDDSAEYGYTALDQKKVYKKIKDLRLSSKILVYPGADEVGFTLLARAYNESRERPLRVYPFFSATRGPLIVPLYEDRVIGESLKSHILASGCQLVDQSDSCDFVLAYNTPGKIMQESWSQLTGSDVSYSSYRNLLDFTNKIESFLTRGKKVAVCDSAYANGGDLELLALLDENKCLEKLSAYQGWNTNCNSLGSSLSMGVFKSVQQEASEVQMSILQSIYEDIFYQTIIRQRITQEVLPEKNLTYFDLKNKKMEIIELVKNDLAGCSKKYLQKSFQTLKNYQVEIDFPWNRMFEIECTLVEN